VVIKAIFKRPNGPAAIHAPDVGEVGCAPATIRMNVEDTRALGRPKHIRAFFHAYHALGHTITTRRLILLHRFAGRRGLMIMSNFGE
jgi:hypothetical protein